MITMETSSLESLYQEDLYKLSGKVVVVICKPWKEVSAEEKTLLEKILGAVKLNLASVQVLECREFGIEDFKSYGPPSCIISFGAIARGSFKKYEHLSVQGISIIVADELNQLDDQKKRNLWATLKSVFQS